MYYIGPFNSLIIFWIVAIVALIVVEVLTTALTTVWFVGGAVAALIAAALGAPVPVQLILFVVLSGVLLFALRPYAVKYFNPKRTATNAESVIGRQGIVTDTIDNAAQRGTVRVDGMDWSARSKLHQQVIETETPVTVCAIDGVKLIVSPQPVVTEKEKNEWKAM